MTTAASLLPEFDAEMASTRRMLEAVPQKEFGWKPHEKSMSLGRLATHLAELPILISHTFRKEEMDMAGPDAMPRGRVAGSREELLELLDRHVSMAREALAAAADEAFHEPWTLRAGSQVILTEPRAAVYRRWGISHMIHHRGQLGVYLRLLDLPVPGAYGPSADGI